MTISSEVLASIEGHPDREAILAILNEEDANSELREGYAISVADPQEWSMALSPSPCDVLIHAEETGELITLPADTSTNMNVSTLRHWCDGVKAVEGGALGEYRGDRWRGVADMFNAGGFDAHSAKWRKRIARHGIEFCFDAHGRNRSIKGAVKRAAEDARTVALARKLADATAVILRREAKRQGRMARRFA